MQNKNLFTLISSGIYKGKKLKLPSLQTTRSTKSIVKGSFFDSWRYDLSSKAFIECFGGSGVMACEAISNGAKMAIAIEKDKAAYKILCENFALFNENMNAILGDSFLKTEEILKKIDFQSILYIDPPFEIRQGFEDVYEKVINLIEKVGEFDIFLICIEHRSEVKFDENIGKFRLLKSKKFGSTTLSYYQK